MEMKNYENWTIGREERRFRKGKKKTDQKYHHIIKNVFLLQKSFLSFQEIFHGRLWEMMKLSKIFSIVRKTFSDSTGNFNRLMPSFLVDEHTLLGV
jgi:hypothetical protein